jgi:hypothetical protein
MADELKNADMQEALRLLKTAMENGDEQAKRVYERLVSMGREIAEASAVIDRTAITHYLCIAPPSAVAEWNQRKRGPVEAVLHSVLGKRMWESEIGITPDSKDVSLVGFDDDASSNIEPPLKSLGLGRDSGHAFFVRWVSIEDPPGKATRFVLGVAYRSSQFSLTNGDAPAHFSVAATSPPQRQKRFWQIWK